VLSRKEGQGENPSLLSFLTQLSPSSTPVRKNDKLVRSTGFGARLLESESVVCESGKLLSRSFSFLFCKLVTRRPVSPLKVAIQVKDTDPGNADRAELGMC
jgi:hypothetical protein